MTHPKQITLLVVAALLGAAVTLSVTELLGVSHILSSSQKSRATSGESKSDASESDESFYTCSMHPQVHKEEPGSCPICGMPLVKKTKGGGKMSEKELAKMGRVSLGPEERVLANVETTSARHETVSRDIRAVGIVSYDETGLTTIPSWIGGRIDRLLVEESGVEIRRGQPIARVYSEELVTAQEEYVVALDTKIPGAGDLRRQARRRLELLGMSSAQIDRLEKTRNIQDNVTIFATSGGTITEVAVREGQYVKSGQPLFKVADLSTVWVEAEVYESDLDDIKEGMEVRVEARAFPDRKFEGKVTLIHPMVDQQTRTNKVRVELENTDEKLKPGMYTTVFFQEDQGPSKKFLVVPSSSVIYSGKGASVYVEVEQNVFERREVEIGRSLDDWVEILDGLEKGDTVAYKGGFLLDSELQLNSIDTGAAGGHDEHSSKDRKDDSSAKAETPEKIAKSDIPQKGKKYEPSVSVEAVPEGSWYCGMSGESHWIQHEKGDGKCPVCGMFLKEKKQAD